MIKEDFTFLTVATDVPKVTCVASCCRVDGGTAVLAGEYSICLIGWVLLDGLGSGEREEIMPERQTIERAREDAREGKSPSTQAGEFVREEMHHIRTGKHGAKSTKQAIAIGLSKARRSGVKLSAPRRGSAKTKKQAKRDTSKGQSRSSRRPSARRSRATSRALKREGHRAASRSSLSRQARSSARQRGSADRHRAARKAIRTKGRARRVQAARKGARTRRRNR
jgi:uncharacterized protein DUF6496